MSHGESQTVSESTERRAAELLEAHREAVLRGWRECIGRRMEESDLEELIADRAIAEDTAALLGHLISYLQGHVSEELHQSIYHWISNGRQYGVRLGDIVLILGDLKEVAGKVCACELGPGEGAGLGLAVGSAIDRMIQQSVEIYQRSRESELESVRQRFEQIMRAWQVEEDLSGAARPEEVFRIGCEHLHRFFPLVGCVARLYGADGEVEAEFSSVPGRLPGRRIHLGRCEWFVELSRRQGVPVLRHFHDMPLKQPGQLPLFEQSAEQSALWKKADRRLAAREVSAVACLPLTMGGEEVGTMVLLSDEVDAFPGAESDLLGDFARVLGTAFDRAAREEASRRQMTEAEVVARIGRLLLELPTVEHLLQAVAEAVQSYRDYERVSLFQAEEDGSCTEVAAAGPLPRGEAQDLPGPVRRCVRKPPMLGPPETGAPAEGDLAEFDVLICKGDRVMGVMQCLSAAPDAFGEGEREGLRELSSHIGLALEKADLLAQRRRDREELEHLHRQLKTIIESTAVGIASLDPDGVYTRWSPSCEHLLGYTEEQVVGKLTPNDLAAKPYDLEETLGKCLRQGQLTRERMMVRRDGEPRAVQEMFMPMRSEEAEHIGFTTCLVDVTEKKRREEDLRRERNRLNLVVDAMEAGLALFDDKKQLIFANNTLEDWFDIQEVRGQPCREVYRCGERHSELCPLHREEWQEGARSVTIERTDESGRWRCYLHVVTRALTGNRQYLVLTTDISDQRRRGEQMKLIDRLIRALQGSLDLERVLHLTLVCVTAGHALGFNRAFIFMLEEGGEKLEGRRAVGPTSAQDAQRIWGELSRQETGLDDLLRSEPAAGDAELTRTVRSLSLPVGDPECLLAQVLRSRSPVIVRRAPEDGRVNRDLLEQLDLEEFVAVPLVAHDEPLGVMIADNRYSGAGIDESGVEELRIFAGQASLAISNARAYHQIQRQIQQIQRTQDKLVQSERLASVGRMAAHLAHEMRTPLALIGGFARAIRREAEVGSGVQEHASTIYEEEQRLEAAVNDVLEFSRPVEAEIEPGDLGSLARETVEEFALDFEEKGIKVEVDLADDLPPVAMDRDLIRQVLINLLSNASEAVAERERPLIQVTTRRDSDRAMVIVSDNGTGMDAETRKNVFAPFFTTRKGGVGLGMAISQRIVREHNGRILISSERGGGSTFRVALPLADEGES